MSWQDDMERERIYRLFEEAGERMDRAWQRWQEFLKEQERFTVEFKQRVCEVTYDYFAKEPPYPDIIERIELDKAKLRQDIEADEQFDWYGTWIFEDTAQTLDRFWEENEPPGVTLCYEKDKWPEFTQEELEKKYQKRLEVHRGYITTPEDKEWLWEQEREYHICDEYHTNFLKTLHKTLKEMVVEYFPMIVDVKPNGFLEVDQVLYIHMSMMKSNLYNIMYGIRKR